ncbi:hypothetical protein ABH939_005700, partial [Rhodococcus sp. 27YEA6]
DESIHCGASSIEPTTDMISLTLDASDHPHIMMHA